MSVARALLAFAVANARYWSTVAPRVRTLLRCWEERARAIEEPELRALALAKLRAERFNAEAAAMVATLAPRAHRRHAVEAIVALELMFDYLDGLTERPLADPLGDGERLYAAFAGALDPGGHTGPSPEPARAGDGYARELATAARAALARLPALEAIAPAARRCALRGAGAQIHMHAVPSLGTAQLADWARRQARGSGLDWRAFLAGAASSVLGLHALIAAAADPRTTPAEADRIDAAYLPIGVVATLLDGVVDHGRDGEAGQLSYAGLYGSSDLLAQALLRACREALRRSRRLRHGSHHAMTLAGAVAYWASAPGARGDFARPVLARLRGELGALVLAPLLLMGAWRAAKRTRERRRATSMGRGRGALAPAGATLALAPMLAATAVSGPRAHAPARPRPARAARALAVRDEGRLHYVTDDATHIVDEGTVSGTIPGRARVDFTYNGSPTVSARFQIRAAGGSIDGSARCRLSDPNSLAPSFRGALTISGGGGRYAHARGSGELFGVFHRRGYSLVVQAIGRLRY